MTQDPLILVVEDDDHIREFVEVVLVDEGYRVVTAANGADALRLAEEHLPDLILLDMRMPIMDGREFARLYARAGVAAAPVVVVTAALEAAERAAEIGAAGHLAKPFDLEALVEVVGRHLRQSGAS